MTNERENNYKKIQIVAGNLDYLLNEVVFLGGSVVGFLLSDTAAPDVRHTLDVDIIVGVQTRKEYYKLSDKLKELGFRECKESGLICRWKIEGIVVDIMPINEKILGFSNRWYPLSMETAQPYQVTEDLKIKLITPPCFIATKLAAFDSRGEAEDFLLSKDVMDIIYVINGRMEIVDEVANSSEELRKYLYRKFKRFLGNQFFLEAIQGALLPDMESQSRSDIIVERIKNIIKNK